MTSAIASCLEIFLDKQIPNAFKISFKEYLPPAEASNKWASLVDITSSFTGPLADALADGIKNRASVDIAIGKFQSFIESIKEANKIIYSDFAEQVN